MNKVYSLSVLGRVSGVGGVGWGCWAARVGVGPFAKKKTSVESVGILGFLWQEL